MANFTETVKWNTPAILRDNLVYGLDRPILENIEVQEGGLSILGDTFGKATYQYDFGRVGTTEAFRFSGNSLLKFRVKTANTIDDLDTTTFLGTQFDSFSGTVFDTIKYTAVPGVYNVQQNYSLLFTGTQIAGSGVFENPAEVFLNSPLSDTYSVKASPRLLVGDPLHNSGALTFLRLSDGLNSIEVQKYQAQIRTRIVDADGNSLGRDVNDNDIILGEPVNVEVNNILTDITPMLSDGVYGRIKDVVSDPEVVEEFTNLKDVVELTNFFGKTSLGEDCVRILGIRADYSLTGILADMQRGLFYRPVRANGYYSLRVPMIGSKADVFANQVNSYNLVSGQYKYAEVNDIWTTKILIPAGIHYYRFIVDGIAYTDSANPHTSNIAVGECSVISVTSTQFIEFIYHGKADEVFVSGSFNGFSDTSNPLEVGSDPSNVISIGLGQTYVNSHSDWHKIDIEFKQPIPVVGIRFLTDVPFIHQQRVKILINDIPITKDEWEVTCSSEEPILPGISECATYSNILSSNYTGDCRSYFINNTDTITASEDGWVEWSFVTNEPINNRTPLLCKKLSFLTRLENGSIFNRSHCGLEILVPIDFVTRATDYLISDNEIEFRTTRRTEVGLNNTWNIPQVVLQNGINIITPVQVFENKVIYGETIAITRSDQYSFIEQIDKSGVSLNNVEVACTLATNLTQELNTVLEVLDLGGISGGGGGGGPRFTRESFTRANDGLRVVVISIEIEPVRIYYLRLVGETTKFRLEVYETLVNAQSGMNRLGYSESTGYGFQEDSNFSPFVQELPIITPNGPVYVDAINIIVCFDQYAADTIFETRPRANV